MTNEQNNQVAAMNASGMSIDEIVSETQIPEADVRAFITSRNKVIKTISSKTKAAVISWYKMGNTERKTANRYGLSQATVHRIIAEAKDNSVKFTANEKRAAEGLPPISNEPCEALTAVSCGTREKQALESAKKKMLEIYETLTPEECRAWEMGEVYAEILRGLE